MNKLDAFTVVIVAVCLAAAALLIYIGINKFRNSEEDLKSNKGSFEEVQNDDFAYLDQDTTLTEPVFDSTAYENQDLNWLDDSKTTTPTKKTTPATSSTTTTTPKTTTPAKPAVTTPVTPPTTTPKVTKPAPTTAVKKGDYMVLAGSFSIRENADNHVQVLKKLGYSNARVEVFDKGSYAVVLVDRFETESAARKLISELKSKHKIESFLKLRE
jgi:cell division septation protein DedD